MTKNHVEQAISDNYSHHLGMELVEHGEGKATARMVIREHHLNGMKRVHGGAVMSLADYAFAAACLSRGRAGVGVNVNVAFIKGARRGILFAHAEEISCGQRLANYRVRVVTEEGQLIAEMQGLAYRKIPHDIRNEIAQPD